MNGQHVSEIELSDAVRYHPRTKKADSHCKVNFLNQPANRANLEHQDPHGSFPAWRKKFCAEGHWPRACHQGLHPCNPAVTTAASLWAPAPQLQLLHQQQGQAPGSGCWSVLVRQGRTATRTPAADKPARDEHKTKTVVAMLTVGAGKKNSHNNETAGCKVRQERWQHRAVSRDQFAGSEHLTACAERRRFDQCVDAKKPGGAVLANETANAISS